MIILYDVQLFYFWYNKSMKQKFAQLLKPRSIAVIGASSTKGKVGNMIAKNILAHAYTGAVYFVNPHRRTILGRKSYSSLAEIPDVVDCTIVVVPAEFVLDVITQGMTKCKNFVVISAGFGESGTGGHNREMKLRDLAEKNDLTILGPNCLGFLIPSFGLNASFAEGLPDDGQVAFISQSGSLLVAMMDKAQEDHTGFSALISIGNKMHVGAAELIEYFIDDPTTAVIALYLEGVVEGGAFLAAIARAHKVGKRVIILKSGRSDDAQKAIALHTGSLAGSDEVFSAALHKVGAIRAGSMDDFFALISLSAQIHKMADSNIQIGVVTNAGGPGVLVTDMIAQEKHIAMSIFSPQTKKILQRSLPVAASVHNPIDVLGDATLQRYQDGIHALIDDKNVDVIMVLLTPQDQTPVDAIADFLIAQQKTTHKMIIASFIGGTRVKKAIGILRGGGVVHFISPQRAIHALAQLYTHTKVFISNHKSVDMVRRKKVQKIIVDAQPRTALFFEEVHKIANLYDITISSFVDITAGISASMHITYPCVVKVDNPKILHKTERGGIILPIKTLAELDHARTTLVQKFPEKGTRVIVQGFVSINTELIIGMVRDPIFGVTIVAGLGGIYTEIFHMVDYYITPLGLTEVKNILKNGVLGFLFFGARGKECYNIDGIAKMIINIALIGQENPEIKAIDINPYLVYNDDTADRAVDFKIII